jgi:hypothetical protein
MWVILTRYSGDFGSKRHYVAGVGAFLTESVIFSFMRLFSNLLFFPGLAKIRF